MTHDIVTDAEFYQLTGKHFPDYEKNSQNRLTDDEKQAIIKSIDIDDFKMTAEVKGMDKEAVDVISSVIKKYEDSNEIYINDFYFGSLAGNGKSVPLLQIEPTGDKTIRLNVNTDIFGTMNVNEINAKIAKSKGILANNLEEAVIHECGHAKVIKNLTVKEISELYDELAKIHIDGISMVALSDGAECLAEVEILVSKGKEAPEKALKLYNKYVRGE